LINIFTSGAHPGEFIHFTCSFEYILFRKPGRISDLSEKGKMQRKNPEIRIF
jgi:hypothetical protein